jgi:hypothetical protein
VVFGIVVVVFGANVVVFGINVVVLGIGTGVCLRKISHKTTPATANTINIITMVNTDIF